MDLETFWFCLIALLWAGYFVLEGFDFGVGMLLPFLPRDERERGLMFKSIGPVRDGNELWLVVAAGTTFAAFPTWYASMALGEHDRKRRRAFVLGSGAGESRPRGAAGLLSRLQR